MSDLTLIERPHFKVFFHHRSALNVLQDNDAQPVSLCGVHSEDFVRLYADFFEAAWGAFHQMGFRLPINCSEAAPCTVHVTECAYHGIMELEGQEYDPSTGLVDTSKAVPKITVKNRYSLAGGFDARIYMKATAAHELFHCVQYSYILDEGKIPHGWIWWLEASATYMESVVFPGSLANHEYLYRWFDLPDRSLDSEGGSHEYGGAIFCEYLANRFGGVSFVREVLERAGGGRTALEVIEELCRERGCVFSSPREEDVFVEGFAVANCLQPTHSAGYPVTLWALLQASFQHVFARKVIRDYPSMNEDSCLNHLACHYYLLRPPRTQANVRISLSSEAATHGEPNLKGLLLFADHAGNGKRLRMVLSTTGGNQYQCSVTIPEFDQSTHRELWILVANTRRDSHGDLSRYSLRVDLV